MEGMRFWEKAAAGMFASTIAVAIAASPAFAASAPAYALDPRNVTFNIPAQPIDAALVAFANQAHVQLVVSPDAARGLRTNGLAGQYDAQSGLEILLRRSGLGFQVTGPNTISIRPVTAAH
jgi:iron complex outermembrane receptor protein